MPHPSERNIRLEQIKRKADAANPAVSGVEAGKDRLTDAANPAVSGVEAGKDRLTDAQRAVVNNMPIIVRHVTKRGRGF